MPEPVFAPVVGAWKGWVQPFRIGASHKYPCRQQIMRNVGSIPLEHTVSIVPLLSVSSRLPAQPNEICKSCGCSESLIFRVGASKHLRGVDKVA